MEFTQTLGLTREFMKHFKRELLDYLDYYNNCRIKAKLKGLPPAIHRQQRLSQSLCIKKLSRTAALTGFRQLFL